MNEPDKGSKSPFYDPKEFRGHTRAPGEELFEWQLHRPPQKSSSGWAAVLVIAVAAGAMYLVASSGQQGGESTISKFLRRATAPDLELEYRQQQQAQAVSQAQQRVWQAASERSRVRTVDACGGQVPMNSGFWMHEGAQNGQSGQWFRFTNMLGGPVFLDIKRAADGLRIATAFIMPGQSAVLASGVARIVVTMSQGSTWCNGLVGWRDGRQTRIGDSLGVDAAALGVTLEFRPGPGGGEHLSLALSNTYPHEDRQRREIEPQRGRIGAVEFPSGQSAQVTKSSTGQYMVAGHINAVPVNFMVDTGASLTSVPEAMGGALGVNSCQRRTFNTANGTTVGCVAVVASVDFGPFVARNVEVALMKNLHVSLLGMNALQGLQLVKVNGGMALQRP